MKHYAYVVLLTLALLLTGCTGESLGDKAIVNAIYLDSCAAGFQTSLYLMETEPSADAGEAKEKIKEVSGAGGSIETAWENMLTKENRRPFYGLNETLLLGPGLQGRDLFDACEFIRRQTSGRPNMQVFHVMNKWEEGWENEALTSLEGLKEDSSGSCFYQMLHSENALIRTVCFLDDTVQENGLELADNSTQMPQKWSGNKAALAAILSGERKSQEVTLNLPEQTVKAVIQHPRLVFSSPEEGYDGLKIDLYGRLIGLNLKESMAASKQIEDEVNLQLSESLCELAKESFGQGRDVFHFENRMKAQNLYSVLQLKASDKLYQSNRIQLSSKLRLF